MLFDSARGGREGGGSRVVAGSESLTVKAVACLIRCRKSELCTRYECYKIAFLTLNKDKIKIRIYYWMAKASENSVAVRCIFLPRSEIIILTVRAHLIATLNVRFDLNHGGLQQTSILLSGGMSGRHNNLIIKLSL